MIKALSSPRTCNGESEIVESSCWQSFALEVFSEQLPEIFNQLMSTPYFKPTDTNFARLISAQEKWC